MIKKFALAWGENENRLRHRIEHDKNACSYEYIDLVQMLFQEVINPYIIENSNGHWGIFKVEGCNDITIIDDGDYQGSLIFIIHSDTYQPGLNDYIYTCIDYGSCFGCDALLNIQSHIEWEEAPNSDAVERYMKLCLHLLQNCHAMGID